ncbi:MAG: hypothetical protein J5J00_02985 [Deltaproteobacteria bacterium]|nr:hypothetical protein [Deltaproteobacteria bacterium]
MMSHAATKADNWQNQNYLPVPHLLPDDTEGLNFSLGPRPQHGQLRIVIPHPLLKLAAIDHRFLISHQLARVECNGRSYPLHTAPALGPVDRVSIAIVNQDTSKGISLHFQLLQNLARYFTSPPPEPFDCKNFVQQIFGDTVEPGFDFSKWTRSDFRAGSTVPASYAVIIYDLLSKRAHHFAISLGDGIFLSKSGVRQGLVIGGLDSMRKVYGVEGVKVLERKDEAGSWTR